MGIITYSIPDFLMSYLINGDSSSLNDDEVTALDNFVRDETSGYKNCHWSYENEQEDSFDAWHDLRKYGILASNCWDVELVIMA